MFTNHYDPSGLDLVAKAAPPGPFALKARLAAARARTAPGTPFWFFMPSPEGAPLAVLLSWPDVPMTTGGNTVWGGDLRPCVLRHHTESAPETRPLTFLVREGHEEDDCEALVAQMKRNGLKLDATVYHFLEWMPPHLGWGQMVAMLPKATITADAK